MKLDPPPLDETDKRLLGALPILGGATTADVARRARLQSGRKHSAILSRRLRYLEMHGLVTRVDSGKPIIWVRTPAGSAALPSPTQEG